MMKINAVSIQKVLPRKTEIFTEAQITRTRSGLFVALRIIEDTSYEGVCFEDLMRSLGQREHSLLMIFVCLILEPFPLLSCAAGPLVLTLALLQFRNKEPWFPRRFRQMTIPPETLQRVTRWGNILEQNLHHFIKPRWEFLLKARFFRWLNLFMLILVSLILTLPLPIPFSNLLPGVLIVLMALAQLERDGALVAVAYALFAGSLVFLYSFGQWALRFFPGLTS